MTSEPSPYVGPRPFETEDQGRFFGRDREASDLLSLVVAHRAVLLYAQSGAGKTSLVNARVVPMLRDEEFEVFPTARLRATIPPEIDLADVDNPFAFSAMLHWAAERGEKPPRLVRLPLRDYLAAHPHPLNEFGEPMPRLLIFDQFEELFTAHAEHWDKRQAFVQQIADALAADPMLRVLLAIREDFVAQLDPFAPLLPGQLQARYRIERLSAPAARLAIEGPLAGTHRRYEPGVPDILVQELLCTKVENAEGEIVEVIGQYVEPVQLQVVCQSIWANLPLDAEVITEEHLRAFGDVDKALNDFYDRVIDETARQTGVKRDRLRAWCENVLITGLGTRNTVYRGPHDTGGMDNAAVDVLDNLRLIRPERRAGARWYELTHDRLIEPIRASNREWYASTDEGRARRLLDQRKGEPGSILSADELRSIEKQLPNLTIDPETQALLDRSRAEIERQRLAERQRRRRERRVRLAVTGAIIAAIVIAGSLVTASLVQQTFQSAAAEQTRSVATAAAAETQGASLIATATQEAEVAFAAQVVSQSLSLASSAQQALAANNPDLALALALEANRVEDPPGPAQSALSQAAYAPGTRSRFEFSSPVYSVAISPALPGNTGAPFAAVGLGDGSIVGLNLATGEEVLRFQRHTRAVNSVAVSPDARYALSGSRDAGDASLILWDTDGEVRRFAAPNWVTSVAFSPDGKTIVCGAADSTVRVWDLETGEARTLTGHTGQVLSVAFSPDGRYVLSGSLDNTVILWDVATGQAALTLTGHTDWVNSVAFTPDGRYGLSGSKDGTMRLWDLVNGVTVGRFAGDSPVNSVAVSPDAQTLLSGAADGTVRLWSVSDGTEIGRLYGHTRSVRSVAFSPDGRYALSGSEDNSARLWDLRNGAEMYRFRGDPGEVGSIALSADGQYILSASSEGYVILWDAETGEELLRLAGHAGNAVDVAFSPDGRYALSGGHDNTMILWNIETGAEIRRFVGHTDWVLAVAFSPDGKTALSGSRDTSLILWDLETGAEIRRFTGHTDLVTGVVFTPDGRFALSSSYDDNLILWDLETGAAVRRFTGHTDDVMCVALNADGSVALSGSKDDSLILWDVESGQALRRFTGHTAAVRDVAFSPDGRLALSASFDNSVRLWNLETGAEIRRYLGHTDRVYGVVFGLDGRTALSGSKDHTLRVWRIDALDELIEWAVNNRYVRELTCAERAQYRATPCDADIYSQAGS